MLVMDEKSKEGKQIARQALRMAVERVTNDNTVTYFAWCLLSWVMWSAVGLALAAVVSQVPQLHAPDSRFIYTLSPRCSALRELCYRSQAAYRAFNWSRDISRA